LKNIDNLRNAISELLATEVKSYNLPSVCMRYGLDPGEEDEANRSKRVYVNKRLQSKQSGFVISLAKQLVEEYESVEFAKTVEQFSEDSLFKISTITRRSILDELIIMGDIQGKLDIVTFLKRVWNIESMSPHYDITGTLEDDIRKHMIANDDWDYNYLFDTVLNILYVSDDIFNKFLESVVHPVVRVKENQKAYVDKINYHIAKDGFTLGSYGEISGYPVYRIFPDEIGVKGKIKNLIFAADGPKPEIVLKDSLNNDIQIVKNEEFCLVYDRQIPQTGLRWIDLVKWASLKEEVETESERKFYIRLEKSLDSKPEKTLFYNYFKHFKGALSDNLPALIPQVYLHYDPYTIRQLDGRKRLNRQRMDFLLLLSDKTRIVIEIDGKQHYSEGDRSSPRLYSEMVKEDRALRLKGYEVYRFGGFELSSDQAEEIVKEFFSNLFKKHCLL
jgi:very-short-patch-repair endonuclease